MNFITLHFLLRHWILRVCRAKESKVLSNLELKGSRLVDLIKRTKRKLVKPQVRLRCKTPTMSLKWIIRALVVERSKTKHLFRHSNNRCTNKKFQRHQRLLKCHLKNKLSINSAELTWGFKNGPKKASFINLRNQFSWNKAFLSFNLTRIFGRLEVKK